MEVAEKSWVLYLILCRGNRLYAGITNDLQARYQAHVDGKGARFTRAHPPLRLVISAPFRDRSEASKAEYAVKQLPRSRKVGFLRNLCSKAHVATPVSA